MYRFVLVLLCIEILPCRSQLNERKNFTLIPVELRGLWCISEWNQNYSRQLGQAFMYNNETFTLNLLDDIKDTWINSLVAINKTDNRGTFQALTDTSKGAPIFVNKVSCFWRRTISNGDILWGRQSNGTCTPLFEMDDSPTSVRYTRNAMNCLYVDDENPNEVLSNSSLEHQLLKFDRSLPDAKRQSIVFYGSSSIRLWSTLTDDFAHTKMDLINRGFGGSTLKQCLQQFKRVILPLEPRILIVYAGENDIAIGETPANIYAMFRQLISVIRRFYPALPVAYISVKPSPNKWDKFSQINLTNNLIREDIRNMNNVHYIDVFNEMLTDDSKPRQELFLQDDLHMNEQGYAIWTRAVDNYLKTNGLISQGVNHSSILYLAIVVKLLLAFFF
ncbi:unnamed protein product [Adineta ricciae]|uniref:SGNH hydrolase-type esterase domain-containing protein n=1 Tax=Adineta ricciae TaxID=249248 RepID=A0A815PKA8_ADIRI|nr:unnamed protein product [Adineta ricciae]CAF1450670.1 unnamed protein product [Adineta ricciae]